MTAMLNFKLALTKQAELHRTPAEAALHQVLETMGDVAVSPAARRCLEDVDILYLVVRHYTSSKLQREMGLDFADSLIELDGHEFYLYTVFTAEGGTSIILKEEYEQREHPLVEWPESEVLWKRTDE